MHRPTSTAVLAVVLSFPFIRPIMIFYIYLLLADNLLLKSFHPYLTDSVVPFPSTRMQNLFFLQLWRKQKEGFHMLLWISSLCSESLARCIYSKISTSWSWSYAVCCCLFSRGSIDELNTPSELSLTSLAVTVALTLPLASQIGEILIFPPSSLPLGTFITNLKLWDHHNLILQGGFLF